MIDLDINKKNYCKLIQAAEIKVSRSAAGYGLRQEIRGKLISETYVGSTNEKIIA